MTDNGNIWRGEDKIACRGTLYQSATNTFVEKNIVAVVYILRKLGQVWKVKKVSPNSHHSCLQSFEVMSIGLAFVKISSNNQNWQSEHFINSCSQIPA